MTEHQRLRAELAKLDGWMEVQRCTRRLRPDPQGVELMGTRDRPSINYSREYRVIPDYLTCHNALHRLLSRLLFYQVEAVVRR